jgi:hypothetical protein
LLEIGLEHRQLVQVGEEHTGTQAVRLLQR